MKLINKKHSYKHTASLLALSLPIAILSATSLHADTIQGFTVTPLNTPEGFVEGTSYAYDLNDSGVVVGSASKNTDLTGRAVLWDSEGNGSELLGHGGSTDNNGVAKAINNYGQAVGSADGPATIWLNGTDSIGTDLYSQLGGGRTLKDINNAGFSIANGKLLNSDLEPTDLLGIYQDLNPLRSETIAINNNNKIIGTVGLRESALLATPIYNPILIEENRYKLLGTLPRFKGGYARPSDINDNNQIVGVSSGGNASRAVIWENDLIASIGTLGGNKSSAIQINNIGQIVGNSTDINNINHAFIWHNDVMYDLSAALCDTPSSCETYARAINNNSEIVASVEEPSGDKLIKLSFEDGALENLPSSYAPLNFITATGTKSGSGAPLKGADISVNLKNYTTGRLNKRTYQVEYFSQFRNSGPKQAKNLTSTFVVSGKVGFIQAYTDSGTCETKVSGSKRNRTVTVLCQHGDLNPGRIFSRTVVVKAKKLRRLVATSTIDSETIDPNTKNNSARLKGAQRARNFLKRR